jgi:outer membrane protein TolC
MILKSLVLILLLPLGAIAQTNTLPFGQVWNEISANSPAQEASRLQSEAMNEAKNRATHHWFPSIYLDARSYQTNDPGNNFFGLLEQRSLLQSDFNPSTINTPGTNAYQRGALIMDLPFYEGGMKSNQVEMLKHSVNAQQNSTNQVQIDLYSQVGLSFGSIGVLEQQQIRFQDLKSEIQRLKKSYKLGNKSNPVGYSGLLGIESIENRLNGLLNQYAAQSRAYYAALKEMGLKYEKWSPLMKDSKSFVESYLLVNNSAQQKNESVHSSFKIQSLKENVAASEKMADMEKARFLPRVGAFAETYVFQGSRTEANGYNAGLYLQWKLFDPADYGLLNEAKTKSLAAKKYSEAMEQQERAEQAGLNESLNALQENIVLMDSSYKLLLEQSKITVTLFQSGAINALQIVEVLNRRAELISQQCEAELALVKAASQVITKNKFDIAQHLADGDKK